MFNPETKDFIISRDVIFNDEVITSKLRKDNRIENDNVEVSSLIRNDDNNIQNDGINHDDIIDNFEDDSTIGSSDEDKEVEDKSELDVTETGLGG